MAAIIRGTKSSAGGGTAFVTATPILPGEVNVDFDTAYSEINGGLNNANIASVADIDETKIGDISATAATHDDTSTPGSSASHSLPTDLPGELKQLRYTTEQLALGVGAVRVDGTGTGTAFWGDLPAHGPNLVRDPNFASTNLLVDTLPLHWTDLGTGTPTFSMVALSGATLTEGTGRELRIQAGSAAVAGITQTYTGLKASTQYLVIARVRATTNAVHLKTTGADVASSFRNIDVSTANSTYTTLKGVIKTDSTPTSIVIQLTTNGANGDDVKVSQVGLFECSADFIQQASTPWMVSTATSAVAISNVSFTDLGVFLRIVPGIGQQAEVMAIVPMERNSANGIVGVQLSENGVVVDYQEISLPASGAKQQAVLRRISTTPTLGTALAYTLEAKASAASAATIPGTSVVAGGGTLTIRLSARTTRNSA